MSDDRTIRIRDHVVNHQRRAIPFPVADQAAIDAAELALGFAIPELLKAIYLEVGNGGFGPGHGGGTIAGLGRDTAADGWDLVGMYEDVRRGAEYDGWEWRDGLLPFCDWGCAIYTCVDCNDRSGRIYLSYECDPFRQRYGLDGFVKRWLKGAEGPF